MTTSAGDDLLLQAMVGDVLVLTLNRPTAANALSVALCGRMHAALDAAAADPAVRAVMLSGGNGKIFCAGADLKERQANPGRDAEMRRPLLALWNALSRFHKPLVLAVNGHAIGGGMEIIFHADAAISSADAEFALPEVQWSGIPGGWSTQTLPRLLGAVRTRWLMLSGERIRADEACRLGIVSTVVPADEVHERALAAAHLLATRPATAVAMVKQAIRQAFDVPLSAGVELEDRLLQIAAAAPERQEKLQSFVAGARPERRKN